MSSWQDKERKKRKVSTAVTDQDRDTLAGAYTFLPQAETQRTSWAGRMVLQYHSHLYKDVVLANMTRVKERQLGLRWRTATEVQSGRGTDTCGNLHCPSVVEHPTPGMQEASSRAQIYMERTCPDREQDEKARAVQLPHGAALTDFEVPFTYSEQGERKTELVKLRLCVRCAPLLFQSKGDKFPYLAACRARACVVVRHSSDDEPHDEPPQHDNVDEEEARPTTYLEEASKKTKYDDDKKEG